jgi:predicted AAA+ superfamily ATPase
MIERNLINTAFSEEFGKQMRFIIGPRQCGKTTAAKCFLQNYNCQKLYYNWDNGLGDVNLILVVAGN